MPLHRFCVHTLTTVYRTIETDGQTTSRTHESVAAPGPISHRENPLLVALNNELRKLNEEANAERTTVDATTTTATTTTTTAAAAPSSKNSEIVTGNTLSSTSGLGNLMPLSQSWLCGAALPNVFTRINDRKTITTQQAQSGDKQDSSDGNTVPIPSSMELPMSHLMPTIPTHWSLLYNSQQHGVGANRFLHHVIGYKGPTLILLQSATKEVFCLASPSEWRETHLYTGNDDCHIIQLLPKYVEFR